MHQMLSKCLRFIHRALALQQMYNIFLLSLTWVDGPAHQTHCCFLWCENLWTPSYLYDLASPGYKCKLFMKNFLKINEKYLDTFFIRHHGINGLKSFQKLQKYLECLISETNTFQAATSSKFCTEACFHGYFPLLQVLFLWLKEAKHAVILWKLADIYPIIMWIFL